MPDGYAEFLARKAIVDPPTGLEVVPELCPALFPFQHDIVAWALRRGRAALFAGTGLGKSLMELAWGDALYRAAGIRTLHLAPLAVSAQLMREAEKFGIDARHVRKQDDCGPSINITNYQKLEHFDLSQFGSVILDESSILKAYDGHYRSRLIEACASIPYRLAATATPAPNDFMELGNHSEFLGVMSYTDMLATFFVHDGSETQQWRLKGHAEQDFWKWMASWSVMLRRPSDLGYADDGYILPPLREYQHIVGVDYAPNLETGLLFPLAAASLQERIGARRGTVKERVERAASITPQDRQFVWWCNLNAESEALAKRIPGAVDLRGSDSEDDKEAKILDFIAGRIRVLVTKASIAGFGLNLQFCADTGFVGLTDSFEQVYQAIRRFWRFGQDKPVNVHFIAAETEGAVVANLKRKEADAERMAEALVAHMADLSAANVRGAWRDRPHYQPHQLMVIPEWIESNMKQVADIQCVEQVVNADYAIYQGDACELVRAVPNDSIHFGIHSPPFIGLYKFSNFDRDISNSDGDLFWEHYAFLISELLRVTMPGRLHSVHCMQLPTNKTREGFIGMRDFRGDIIRAYQRAGWIFHSEVCIWKDPVVAQQRSKSIRLLHKQIVKDSTISGQGLADYIVTFRKPGDNIEAVDGHFDRFAGTGLDISREAYERDAVQMRAEGREPWPFQQWVSILVWQRYASPVWTDIDQTNTLQYRSGRDPKDEQHISPLQLDVIERCIDLWSNPSDVVLTPFLGIGSEVYCAIRMGRRGIGFELKPSYFAQAVRNLASAKADVGGLFAAE